MIKARLGNCLAFNREMKERGKRAYVYFLPFGWCPSRVIYFAIFIPRIGNKRGKRKVGLTNVVLKRKLSWKITLWVFFFFSYCDEIWLITTAGLRDKKPLYVCGHCIANFLVLSIRVLALYDLWSCLRYEKSHVWITTVPFSEFCVSSRMLIESKEN